MKFFTLLLILGMLFAIKVWAQGPSEADKLFSEGKFEEAQHHYKNILDSDSKNFDALLRLGNISLLKNQHVEAEKFLNDALQLRPKHEQAMTLLAEVYVRQDKFEKAAPLFRSLRIDAVAKKLESFKGLVPYEMDEKLGATRIKFVHTDPLPLIQVKVNDHQANFILDTGGSEVYVDPKLLKKVGGLDFGTTVGMYGGGKQAATGHGKIDSLTIGDFTIENVPVHILDTTKFSAAARGLEVHGIVGTVLFYHFISTIDYPAGELILQRKSSEALKAIEDTEGQIVIPFWMSGDHFMVSWGRVNDSEPQLLFVDTGLAGGGFIPSESAFKSSGIELSDGQGFEGIGGGGKVTVVPFEVEKLSLGDAVETNITGIYGPFPPQLEMSEGFRIAGIISHDFFRSYTVTFDFEGMRLFLRKKSI